LTWCHDSPWLTSEFSYAVPGVCFLFLLSA
jgi:hypothetical protein